MIEENIKNQTEYKNMDICKVSDPEIVKEGGKIKVSGFSKEDLEAMYKVIEGNILEDQPINQMAFYELCSNPRMINWKEYEFDFNCLKKLLNEISCIVCKNVFEICEWTKCSHRVCHKCMIECIKNNKKCPICNSKIKNKRELREDVRFQLLSNNSLI